MIRLGGGGKIAPWHQDTGAPVLEGSRGSEVITVTTPMEERSADPGISGPTASTPKTNMEIEQQPFEDGFYY